MSLALILPDCKVPFCFQKATRDFTWKIVDGSRKNIIKEVHWLFCNQHYDECCEYHADDWEDDPLADFYDDRLESDYSDPFPDFLL